MRILISAAGSAAAASVIRHLKRLGHYVIGIDADENSALFAQDICDEFILSPYAISPDYPTFLLSIKNKFDLFIPFIDEELRIFASGEICFSIMSKSLLCKKDAIDICTSKIKFQKHCETNNIPIAPIASNVPAIFKPEYGRGSKGIHKIFSQQQLLAIKNEHNDGIVQSLLYGTEYTVDVLISKSGRWLFGLPRKRLQTNGVSRIGEVDINKSVLSLAKRCVETLQFSYAINIQIMLDNKGDCYVIEINPRLAGSAVFSVAAGFDIFNLVISMFENKPLTIPEYNEISKLRSIRYWEEKHYVIN